MTEIDRIGYMNMHLKCELNIVKLILNFIY